MILEPKIFYGVVEDIKDPEKLGKVRVRIYGIHSEIKSKKDDRGIPTEDLNWSHVSLPTTSPSISGVSETPCLKQGTWVWGFSRDGELYQDLVVCGTFAGVPYEEPNTRIGFNDPDGIFPRADHLLESDLNRLSRNEDISNTIVKTKKDNRERSVQTANGHAVWKEPETPYDAEYPLNQVTETESGHIVEFDDTPGKERIHQYHKSGSFEEIHPDGSKVTKIVGDDYIIILKDSNMYVKGDVNITVLGDASLRVEGNLEEEIEGNVNRHIKGDVTEVVDGTVTESASSYTTNGRITQSGGIATDSDVSADGEVNSKVEVTAGIISLTTHKHPTAAPGAPSIPIP